MRHLKLSFFLIAVLSVPGLAAATGYGELFDAIPAPPATVEDAGDWVEGETLVAPQVLGTQARLEAAKQNTGNADAPAKSATAVADALAAWDRYRQETDGKDAGSVLADRTQWLLNRFAALQKRNSDPEQARHMREQELAAYGTLFRSWKQERSPIIWLAQSKLAAAGAPEKLDDLQQRETLMSFSDALLAESEALLGLTRLAAERANGLSEPDLDAAPDNRPSTLWDLMKNPE